MDVSEHGPMSAVDDFGRFRFGSFRTPIYYPNFHDAHLSDCTAFWGRAGVRGLAARIRAMRLKEWHFVCVVGEEWILWAAIAQLGYAGHVSCCLLERDTSTLHQVTLVTPLGRNIRFADSSVRGTTTWRDGNDYVVFEYQPQGGGLWSCSFNLPFPDPDSARERRPPRRDRRRLKGQVSILANDCVALLYPLDSNRAAYTHKEAGNRAEGLLSFGVEELRFENDSSATMDWTRSFADRHTRWNWLTATGMSGDCRRLGINLSEHLYGGAENFVWLDGSPRPLGVVEFVPPRDKGLPWHISSDRCTLQFLPECERKQRISLPFGRSSLTQHFGVLEGAVRLGDSPIHLHGLCGICEQHDAVW